MVQVTTTASLEMNCIESPTEHLSGNRPGELNGFQLPVIGAPLGVICAAACERKPSIPPGNITALVIYLLSSGGVLLRKKCCKTSKAICSSPTATRRLKCRFRFDGPQLAKPRAVTVDKMLRQRVAVPMDGSYLPALLIRLGIDDQTRLRRKPDYQWQR